MTDYGKCKRSVNQAYKKTDTAQEFIDEILKIWAGAGFIKGEWSCQIGMDKVE
jgi:hypothetical protein